MALLDDLDRGLVDLIFPRDCVVTQRPMEAGPRRHLSEAGALELARIADPRCLRCGHPFDGTLEGDRTCPHCLGLHPAFGRAVCPFRARGPVREIIHLIKYGGRPWLVDDLAEVALTDTLFRRHLMGAVLVPVPLHAGRQRERGYNQAERVAAWLAPRLPGCTFAPLLVKPDATISQTRLDRQERRANVRRAFRLAPGRALDPERRYVILDDVLTTGATLHACAATLRAAGAHHVDAAALAHG
jgi:ComF family protein